MAEAVPVAEASLGLFGSVCGVGHLRGGGALDGFGLLRRAPGGRPGDRLGRGESDTGQRVELGMYVRGGVGLGRDAVVVERFHERVSFQGSRALALPQSAGGATVGSGSALWWALVQR